MTAPTWRTVLYTLEPAPASSPGRLRVAIMDSGPHIIELPRPDRAAMASNHSGLMSGLVINAMSPKLMPVMVRPAMANGFGECTFVCLPTSGESTPEIIPDGTSSSAASVGVYSLTVWM